ncbi:hypothetical protein [Polaribacter sp. R77954]|uniref:hypothetical protein n=1 Tax=Polaribacter sp. R77954 TaxID=3093870 RepID=UPI0037CC02C2
MNSISFYKERINSAKNLDFGTMFNLIIELYKKVWVQGLLLFIFNVIIMLPIIILVYVPLIVASFARAESGDYSSDFMTDFFTGFSFVYIVGILFLFIVLIALSAALIAGFYRIVNRLDFNHLVNTSDFFYFIKKKYILKLLVLMVVSMIIVALSALLCYVPLIYTMVPVSFFIVFFTFNPELSVGAIFELSFKLGTKKWLITFGLLLVIGIIVTIIGTITCGLGYFFLIPFSYLPIYIIYKEVIGFEETNEINEIGNPMLNE